MDGESSATALLETFATKIAEKVSEAASELDRKDENDNDSEEEEGKTTRKEDRKSTASREIDTTVSDYAGVLAFLQENAIKATRVVGAPLQLCADKRARDWLHKWVTNYITPLSTPITAAPQDHSGITGVLSDATMRLHNT